MDWRLTAAVVSCAALIVTSVFVQRDMGSSTFLQRFAYAMFPISQLLTAAVLFVWIFQLGLSDEMLLVVCAVTIICCPVDVLLFRKLRQAQDKEFAEARVRMLSEQLEIQERYNAKLKEDMANIDRVRSAAEQEFAKAAQLIAQDPACSVDEAFEGVQAVMGDAALRYCDNPIIDVIADVKHADCEAAGIETFFALEVPRRTPSISDVELCAVFSNLIDNALEAAKRSAEAGTAAPFVELASEVRGNTLTVRTKNSMPTGPLHAEASERTKKQHARKPFKSIEDHGWGLSIVEEIAIRHDGALVTSAKGDVFNASAMLVFDGAQAG